jgi:hypothetical protein
MKRSFLILALVVFSATGCKSSSRRSPSDRRTPQPTRPVVPSPAPTPTADATVFAANSPCHANNRRTNIRLAPIHGFDYVAGGGRAAMFTAKLQGSTRRDRVVIDLAPGLLSTTTPVRFSGQTNYRTCNACAVLILEEAWLIASAGTITTTAYQPGRALTANVTGLVFDQFRQKPDGTYELVPNGCHLTVDGTYPLSLHIDPPAAAASLPSSNPLVVWANANGLSTEEFADEVGGDVAKQLASGLEVLPLFVDL